MALNWDSLSDLFDEQSEVTDALIGFLAEPSDVSQLNINTLFSWKPGICLSQEYTGCNINLIPNQKPEIHLSLEDTEFNVNSLLNPQSEMCLAEEDIGFDMPSLLSLEPEINLLAKTEPDKLPAINCSVRSAPRNLPLDEAWYNGNAEYAPALLSNCNLSCNNLSGSMSTNNPSNVSLHHDSYKAHAEIVPAPLTKCHKSSSNLFGTEAFNNPANSVHQGPGFTVGSSNKVHRRAVPALQHVSARNIAARQRSRKISEKTKELGKLIPGGTHLMTADMLLASIRYVKFLQAQVGVLAQMESNKASDVPSMAQEHLQVLLGSTTVQKILASEEKCLVPIELAESWAQQNEIQSNSVVSRDLAHFLKSIN